VHPVEISDRQGSLPGRGEVPGSLDDIHSARPSPPPGSGLLRWGM